MEGNIQKINFFQRLKIAIFKLEDYGTFLGERIFTALKYFFILILLVSVIIPIVATYQFSNMTNKFLNYVQNELPDFTYENGKINFIQKVNAYDNDFDFSFIADTEEMLDDKTIAQYKNEIGEYGLILLKNKAIFISNDMELEEEYVKLFEQNELNINNKSDLINLLSQINLNTVLGTYFIVCFILNYIVKVFYIFIDVCSIAVFGWIAAKLCGINFKVEPIFSLSIYSISLSVILNAIYECFVNITGFEIEYFDIICLLISYIYIIAAIFMIKYDLIKQTEELQKILEVQKQVKRDGELDNLSNNDKKDKEDKNKEDEKKKENNEDKNDNNVDEPVIENKEPDRFRNIIRRNVKLMKKDEKQNKHKKRKDQETIKTIVLLILLVLCLAGAFAVYYFGNKDSEEKELAYTDLITSINEGKIEKIEMTTGSQTVKVTVAGEGDEKDREKSVLVPSIQAFMEWVQEKVDKEGAQIELIQEPINPLLRISDTVFSLLPTILLVVLMIMIFKMQGLGGDSGKVYGGEDGLKPTGVKFTDIAGLDEEKDELIEIVDFLKNPTAYLEMGAKIPRGILLYGKPGTGKTLIAKAIAGEAGVPFISMSGSEFIEMFAGLGASRVRKLFEKAKKMSPCIIFIDEIDAIGSRRTSNTGSETENNQTLNQLLVEMDGFDTNETVIVLAATNRPEMLDKALLRPGRFDRQITIPAPDLIGREKILKLHSQNKKFASDVDFRSIAGDTAGFTGAELANVLNEAAILATRNKHKEITNLDIENAVKKITVGLEKANRVISDKDKKLTAYHEAGHAVVSKFLPTQTDVKEVSIIPRGLAGGYTMYKTNEDKFYVSRTELLERMVALMGGRAAEKIALNEISTGASNDIEVATGIAKDMLTVYGMDDSLGPISLKVDDPYELQIFGDKVIDQVGNQIQILIDNAYITAQKILAENMDILDKVAQSLLEKEKITSEEFEEFFK